MMANEGGKKNTSFLRIVQERAKLKEAEEKEKKKQLQLVAQSIPSLPQDCVSHILVRLPIDSLQRSICVCRVWCDMICSPSLIQSHANRSETVIIFQTSAPRDRMYSFSETPALKHHPAEFCVEDCLVEPTNFFNRPDMKPWLKCYIHFMEIANGKGVVRDFNISCLGRIMSSCNGLILLENKMKKGGLILMNPVTRKLVALPVGTISPSHKRSYALVSDPSASKYKVVHLFQDESDYTSCEILVLGQRSWKMVNAPPFGLISWFGYKPVFAVGALHWFPHIDHNDYIVSMEIETERFKTIELPKSGRTRDRVFEMGGFLCFASHEEMEIDQIDIWVLKTLSEENWTRIHKVIGCCSLHMIAISGSRFGGQIIFTRDEDGAAALYDYDPRLKSMSKIDVGKNDSLGDSYLPHVNSLVSWEKERK